MSATSNVIPFGLLYMRFQQWWLKTKGFSPRVNPLCMIKVTRRCLRALDMWRKPLFFVSGPGAESSLSPRNASDGCLSHRLGSGHVWPPCPWSVEWSPSHVAHQLPGDAGRVLNTQKLSTTPSPRGETDMERARRWIRLRLVRNRTVPSGYLWLIQLRWGWMLWYRFGRGFVCTPFPDLFAHRRSRECAGMGSIYC